MRGLRWLLRAWAMGVILLGALPARGAPPDRRTAEGRLEDAILDGEIDAEDLLSFRYAPGALLGGGRGAAYVGIEAFRVDKAVGASEMGALLVVELPLERWGRAPVPLASTSLASPSAGWTDVETGPSLGAAIAQSPAPRASSVAPAPPSPAPVISVTTEVARSCVRAALRAMGLGDDQRLDSVAARSRSSAALPELRLRAVRTLGESGRISLSSEDDPSRYVASGVATNVIEARLTFRLDRLLFADEEIAVERARIDRSELRTRTTAKVLQALFEWQKAYVLAQDGALPAEERLSAVLREAESSAILDMMTGGWFGAFRAALAARGP